MGSAGSRAFYRLLYNISPWTGSTHTRYCSVPTHTAHTSLSALFRYGTYYYCTCVRCAGDVKFRFRRSVSHALLPPPPLSYRLRFSAPDAHDSSTAHIAADKIRPLYFLNVLRAFRSTGRPTVVVIVSR